MTNKRPIVKILAKDISVDEACEIIAKSVEHKYDSDCKYDDPFVEKTLELFDEMYRDQVTKMVVDIIGAINGHVDIRRDSKID